MSRKKGGQAWTGKKTGHYHYVHKDWLRGAHPKLKKAYRVALWNLDYARNTLPIGSYVPEESEWNVIKYDVYGTGDKISLLMYERFDIDPHPALKWSIVVDLTGEDARVWETIHYWHKENRPIIHRKELMVGQDHPDYRRWVALTAEEKAAGLLGKEHIQRIGYSKYWDALLKEKCLKIEFDVLLDDDKCPECGKEI